MQLALANGPPDQAGGGIWPRERNMRKKVEVGSLFLGRPGRQCHSCWGTLRPPLRRAPSNGARRPSHAPRHRLIAGTRATTRSHSGVGRRQGRVWIAGLPGDADGAAGREGTCPRIPSLRWRRWRRCGRASCSRVSRLTSGRVVQVLTALWRSTMGRCAQRRLVCRGEWARAGARRQGSPTTPPTLQGQPAWRAGASAAVPPGAGGASPSPRRPLRHGPMPQSLPLLWDLGDYALRG